MPPGADAVFALPPEQQTNRFLWNVAHRVTPNGQAHVFNQAIMDWARLFVWRARRVVQRGPVRRVCRSVQKGREDKDAGTQ